MEKNEDETSQDEIFDLFMKWKNTPKNQQTSLALTLKEKISETIPNAYGIKVEECNMRYFVLLTDSDFFKCNTAPFTCVYDFCQYLKAFHQKEDDWYDTLLPHCIPGSDRQQWIAYNIYRFKFTWKQVCFRLMQKYDSPSRRTGLEKTLRESKFDPSQSIQRFNERFNAYIDELFYDEHIAIEVYKTIIPAEYADMLSSTITIDKLTSFIYTLADIQQRAADMINASDNDIICYTSASHTVYSTESETTVCCQDLHSITDCPETHVLRWSKNDPRNNNKNEAETPLAPISFLRRASKTKATETVAAVVASPVAVTAHVPATPTALSSIISPIVNQVRPSTVVSSAMPLAASSAMPSALTPSGLISKSNTQPPQTNFSPPLSSSTSSSPSPLQRPLISSPRPIVNHQKRFPPKRKPPPQSRIGERIPPQVKKTKKVVKCRNCGANYSYGHNNVCSRRGGRIISRTR